MIRRTSRAHANAWNRWAALAVVEERALAKRIGARASRRDRSDQSRFLL